MKKEIYIIENGIQSRENFPRWHLPDYTHTGIHELTETMRIHTCKVMILNWESGFTVLEKSERTFTGTQKIGESFSKIRKIVKTLRADGEVSEEKIPLIVVSSQNRLRGKRYMFSRWGEALFIARRILHERTDDIREIVYLAKSSQHAQKLKNLWENTWKHDNGTKKITVRIETDIRDILGPIEAREYPEFIRLYRTMVKRMYIGERDLEFGENEALAFAYRRRNKKTKMGRIIPLIDRDDENIPDMLSRLTHGKTQVQLYGKDYPPAEELCYPHIDVPKTLSQVRWI